MKKLLKVLGIFGLVIALVLIGASVALHFLLPPEKAKTLVLKQLSEHLKREVRVGDVSVGLFSGLSLSNLKISEAPTFAQGTFVTSDQFSVKVALLPLLTKEIVVNQIILKHPVVRIVRFKDGKTFNFSDLAERPSPSASVPSASTLSLLGRGSKGEGGLFAIPIAYAASAAPTPAPAEASSFKLLVSLAQIQGGILHFVDESPAKQSLEIDPLDLKLKNLSLTAPFGIQTTLTVSSKGVKASLSLEGQADAAAGSLSIKTFALSGAGLASPLTGDAHLKGNAQSMEVSSHLRLASIELTSHGKIQSLTSGQPQMNMHFETNRFTVSDLLNLLPMALPKELRLKGQAQLAADISGTTASCALAAKIDAQATEVVFPGQFMKPSGTPFELSLIGDYVGTPQTINASTLKLTLGSLQVQGQGTYRLAAARFNTTLKSNAFALGPLAALVPALAAYQPSGTATLNVRASGTTTAPSYNGTLTLQDVGAHYEQSELTHLAGVVTFTQQDVSIPKLTGKLNGSDLILKVVGHQLTTRPDLMVEGTVGVLDLDKLISPPKAQAWHLSWPLVAVAYAAAPVSQALRPMHLSGHMIVRQVKHEFYKAQNLDLKWNLFGVTPDLGQIKGLANVKQGAGVIQNVEKLAASARSVQVFLAPVIALQKMDKNGILKGIGVPSLQTISFTGIRGDYVFDQGVMDIRTFELVGKEVNIDTKGTIGLAGAQPLDVRVVMKLAQGLVGGTVGQIFNDESGRAVLNFTAQGTVANPQVRLDVKEAAQKAVHQVGQEILKNEDVKKALQNIFR